LNNMPSTLTKLSLVKVKNNKRDGLSICCAVYVYIGLMKNRYTGVTICVIACSVNITIEYDQSFVHIRKIRFE